MTVAITKSYNRILLFSLLMMAGRTLVWSDDTLLTSPLEYRVSFDGVLDNREYHRPLTDQTLFFMRGEMELGYALDERHKMRGGVSYTQEFGAPETADNLYALLYYHYDNEGRGAQFHFGAFPRAGALELPKWFFGDEAAYYRPFVHGAAVEINTHGVTLGAWVDWTGRQTEIVNESFLFGYGAKYRHGWFFAEHDFMMYHFAHTDPYTPGEHVQDNGGASAEIGVILGGYKYVDTLWLAVGGMVSLDRDRGDNVWYTPAGGFVRGEANKAFFLLRFFYYTGEPQRFIWGDDFFAFSELGTLLRLDAGIRFNDKRHFSMELSQSFHFYNNRIGYSQHFLLKAELKKR
ncbi:MAG: hypothetical protein LBU70_06420 [Chitinispirillales bacterium]|jgi:hypothetical protein|nr:hypothetical protein [Chitinispirillales bacterium]